MDLIHIITPLSRPQYLAAMAANLRPHLRYIVWHICVDSLACDARNEYAALMPWALWYWHGDPRSHVGKAQVNHVLDNACMDGWVYVLDDDNLLHPDLPALVHACKTGALVVAQALQDGERRACDLRPGHIDQAQYVLRRGLIGKRRYDVGRYDADGAFIEQLHAERPGEFTCIEQVASYYNRLRWVT